MQIEIAALPLPCAIVDLNGTLHETNALWQARFGAGAQLASCLPQAQEKLRALAQSATREAACASAFFDDTVRAPGELAPFLLRFVPLATANQNGPAVTENLWLLAVSESREAETETSATDRETREAERAMDAVALRLQARNWRAFFRDAAAGKALICLQGRTLEVNDALCKLTGYSEHELLHLLARDLRHPDDRDRVDAHYQSILDGGPGVAGIESRYRHKDGHYLICLLSITLIRDSRGRPLYFTAEVEDITLRRRVEERLRHQTQQLERANRELLRSNAELERFAFVASHDLQEPLRKIRVFGDRLLQTSFDSAHAPRYIDGMTRAAARMQNLIEDLLSYGRLQDYAQPFAPVDLSALWAELREEFEDAIRESGARVEVGDLPVVDGNAFRLKQLFANLLSNALKFRGEEPPHVQVSAVAATDAANDADDAPAQVTIEVRDNGIGFDEADAEAIFAVFARLHTRRKYPGTGIGLAICRRVAREHGGNVRAFAAPDEGARFVVTLAD